MQEIQRDLDADAAANPTAFKNARPVRPVLKCVERLAGNQLKAHFGYVNSAANVVSIPVGFFNRFWPPPSNRGQPSSFAAGAAADVVQVPFGAFGASIWVLGSHFAIATKFSRPCPASGAGGQTGTGGNTGAGGIGGTGGKPSSSCPSTCDDRNPCTLETCSADTNFMCVSVPVIDGVGCNAGNPCTNGDTCQSGVCTAGAPVVCPAPTGPCQGASTCNVANGLCVAVPSPEGAACSNAGNRCHVVGACQAGVCLDPGSADCSACDQCSFGVPPGQADVCTTTADACANCDPTTDGCAAIADPTDRILCERLYACLVAPTHPGTSIPGACIFNGDPLACWCGTNSSTCATSNDPATQGNGPCRPQIVAAAKTPNAATIFQHFLDPKLPLGRAIALAACQGNFCASECQLPVPPAPCTRLDACHQVGFRDPITGTCSNPTAPDGAVCDDGNGCTPTDHCQSGVCVSGPSCPVSGQCHTASTCDTTTQRCVDTAAPDGTPCVGGEGCALGTCAAGFCRSPPSSSCGACDQCTFGVTPGQPDLCSATPEGCFNCDRTTDDCDGLASDADRRLCNSLLACLVAPAHPGTSVPGACLVAGDPLLCWCGTNQVTCFSDNAPPRQANGPCLQQVLSAAGSSDASTISRRLTDPNFPLGRAFNLAACESNFCARACAAPP